MPAPPVSWSAPAPPSNVSARLPPISVSAPAPPVTLYRCVVVPAPVKFRVSAWSPAVLASASASRPDALIVMTSVVAAAASVSLSLSMTRTYWLPVLAPAMSPSEAKVSASMPVMRFAAVVVVSPLSVRVSVPAPPAIVSLSVKLAPATMVSLPAPPSMFSLSAPMVILSSPAAPAIVF